MGRFSRFRELEAKVAEHDAELAKTVRVALMVSDSSLTVETYGVIYLLAVLHRVDPAAADRAARELVGAWEAGDVIGEHEYQWRDELGKGLPLTLYGFPHIEIGGDGA